MPTVSLRKFSLVVREAMQRAGLSEIPEVVPVDLADQILLHTQYRLVELSAGPPYIHQVSSIPHTEGMENIAVVLEAARASTHLNPNVVFHLTFSKNTFEIVLGEIHVRRSETSESSLLFSRIF